MSNFHIVVEINIQTLYVYQKNQKSWFNSEERWKEKINSKPIFTSLISTSANGVGQQNNSFKTPLGRHKIRAKIGRAMPINSVFVGRRPTGEIWNKNLSLNFPQRDWILTRILWLSGLDKGHNRFGEVDTMKRFIYIHGSPPGVTMGRIGSKGCIRMTAEDVIYLFNLIPSGTTIDIKL